MNGDSTDNNLDDDIAVDESVDESADDATDENTVLTTDVEGFADTVVEANVDALVARMDSKDADEVARKREARKRLDQVREQQDDDLDGTFNFNLDDDL
jgi:uncharacterized protein (DUF2342 family)